MIAGDVNFIPWLLTAVSLCMAITYLGLYGLVVVALITSIIVNFTMRIRQKEINRRRESTF